MGDNGNGVIKKDEIVGKFKNWVIVGITAEGDILTDVNVTNPVTGYGLCEFGKIGVDQHIARISAEKAKIIKPGAMHDFARKFRRK